MMKQQSTYARLQNTNNIQIWEVVAVSIVLNEDTISSIKVYSLSLEQTTNKLGNISYKRWL